VTGMNFFSGKVLFFVIPILWAGALGSAAGAI
jgi:hypothetical protein